MLEAEPPLGPTADDEPLPTDPGNWPSPLTDRIRTELVRRQSILLPDFVFPRNESDGRSCHHQYFKKISVSGEKMAKSWMIHSMANKQPLLLLLQIVFQEVHYFSKGWQTGSMQAFTSLHTKTVQNISIA